MEIISKICTTKTPAWPACLRAASASDYLSVRAPNARRPPLSRATPADSSLGSSAGQSASGRRWPGTTATGGRAVAVFSVESRKSSPQITLGTDEEEEEEAAAAAAANEGRPTATTATSRRIC